MRKPVIVIFILLLLEAVSGCTSPVRRQLDRAEAVMESAPDSALAILDSIDTASLTRASDRALYALLLTQGRIKTYEVLTDDSLISTAVSYYEDHGPDSNLMKSLFYQGEILTNNREFSKAIIPSMRAREMAISADNPYWHAKASELISYVYNYTHYYEESIKFSREAAEKYSESGHTINSRYSLCDIAIGFSSIRNHKRSIEIADSIYKISLDDSDSHLIVYALDIAFNGYYQSKDYKAADSVSNILNEYQSEAEKPEARKICEAITRMEQGDFTLITHLIRLCNTDSLSFTKLNKYVMMTSYYNKIKDIENSKKYQDSAMFEQDKVVDNLLKQSVISSQRDFLLKENEKETMRAERTGYILFGLTIIFIIILSFIFYTYRQRLKIRNLELTQKIHDIHLLNTNLESLIKINQTLSIELDKKEDNISKLKSLVESRNLNLNTMIKEFRRQTQEIRSEVENICYDRWRIINELCEKYIEIQESGSVNLLSGAIDRRIKDLSTKKTIEEIKFYVDKYRGGLISDIVLAMPTLKPDEITMLALICVGFSAKTICYLMDTKLKTFYTRKTRLADKIKKSDIKNKDRYLEIMGGKHL